jgi:hypothetical protein
VSSKRHKQRFHDTTPTIRNCSTFFHPDYTVGPGIPPESALERSRAITAGQESHPALKVMRKSNYTLILALFPHRVKSPGKTKTNSSA